MVAFRRPPIDLFLSIPTQVIVQRDKEMTYLLHAFDFQILPLKYPRKGRGPPDRDSVLLKISPPLVCFHFVMSQSFIEHTHKLV